MKNMTFFQSVKCAWAGIGKAVSTEKNFRRYAFLTVLFFTVNLFVFRLSFTQHLIYFAVCCGAFSAEFMNTSVEKLSDALTDEVSERIGAVKDIAAAGVLAWGFLYFGMEIVHAVRIILMAAGVI